MCLMFLRCLVRHKRCFVSQSASQDTSRQKISKYASKRDVLWLGIMRSTKAHAHLRAENGKQGTRSVKHCVCTTNTKHRTWTKNSAWNYASGALSREIRTWNGRRHKKNDHKTPPCFAQGRENTASVPQVPSDKCCSTCSRPTLKCGT